MLFVRHDYKAQLFFEREILHIRAQRSRHCSQTEKGGKVKMMEKCFFKKNKIGPSDFLSKISTEKKIFSLFQIFGAYCIFDLSDTDGFNYVLKHMSNLI
jgi:hypothetical protein